MGEFLSQLAVARQPQQQRSRNRFLRMLEEAEALLAESGLAGFSIPALAERLDYSRASIYKYFPSPYAILNELLMRYLSQLEDMLHRMADPPPKMPWQDLVRANVMMAAGFYNDNPVARLLILGGPVTDESYRAQKITIQHLGSLARQIMQQRGIELPPPPPDIAALAVDTGTTCFRLSHFLHGSITPEYREEAVHAMVAYLARYIEGGTERND